VLFLATLAILMVPYAAILIPLYVVEEAALVDGCTSFGALRRMAVPCVALFLGLQRHYAQGFTTGALRG
jgi:ABC-type maltose transport system permease subunit